MNGVWQELRQVLSVVAFRDGVGGIGTGLCGGLCFQDVDSGFKESAFQG